MAQLNDESTALIVPLFSLANLYEEGSNSFLSGPSSILSDCRKRFQYYACRIKALVRVSEDFAATFINPAACQAAVCY